MTDEHEHAEHADHDSLRALLQSADPASALPPADPTRVTRLLEDTMTDQLTDESRSDGPHDRSRLTWLVAAAAAVLIAGGMAFALTQGEDDPVPTAGDTPSSRAAADGVPTVTELTAAGGGATAGKCMTPDAAPEVVAAQTTVFDGTVEAISGSMVTLEPTRFYAGEETDVVVVKAPGRDMQALLSAVVFEEGQRYLVAATDGQVTLCGFSAVYSDDLAAVYDQAFPG
ncbi:MAG: hypothetical protein JWN84_1932 [Nocardioides sp.]|jgi:hypothetical protein|nr:hypothetical protein [Nocardioides sp.]